MSLMQCLVYINVKVINAYRRQNIKKNEILISNRGGTSSQGLFHELILSWLIPTCKELGSSFLYFLCPLICEFWDDFNQLVYFTYREEKFKNRILLLKEHKK